MSFFRRALPAFWIAFLSPLAWAEKQPELPWPPTLPDGKAVVTDSSPDMLKPSGPLRDGVEIAKTPPTVDFLYYPGQIEAGAPWSNWGDGVAIGSKYYSTTGNHKGIGGQCYVYEYDSATHNFRMLVDVKKFLNMPETDYTPGKIHGRIDMGKDGWLYWATARGSTGVTTAKYNFKGDWILRTNPTTNVTEIVERGPVPDGSYLCDRTDPDRLIMYVGVTHADGNNNSIRLLAYDLVKHKVMCVADDGPSRYIILSRSSGRIYYLGYNSGKLYRYDPATPGKPVEIPGYVGCRAATEETAAGIVYTCSGRVESMMYKEKEDADAGAKAADGKTPTILDIYAFDLKTEKATKLGPAPVASATYITTMEVDPTGRYLYYVPGAHGGAEKDGSPVVQYDIKTGKRKVLAFLHPFYKDKYGFMPMGTFGTALSPEGDKLYVTWHGRRGPVSTKWKMMFDTCALTVIHIPESERQP